MSAIDLSAIDLSVLMVSDHEGEDEVHVRMQEWADWARRYGLHLGYPSRSVEGRMMDDRGVLPAGTRVIDRRIPQSDQVAQIEELVANWKREAMGLRSGWRAHLWRAVEARYLSGVTGKNEQARRARMSVSTYANRLREARAVVRMVLGL